MSAFEQWLVNNIMEVAVILGGGTAAFIKLNGWTKTVAKEVASNGKMLKDHLDAEYPHPSCRIEQERLGGIHDQLKSINDHLAKLDDRIIQIIRNDVARSRQREETT